MNILFMLLFLLILLNFPVTIVSERIGTSDAIRLKRALEQFLRHATKALGATLGAAAIVDQVNQAKNAGPQPIDPNITGKYGGLNRLVWIEMAKRQENREAVRKYQKKWKKENADWSVAVGN